MSYHIDMKKRKYSFFYFCPRDLFITPAHPRARARSSRFICSQETATIGSRPQKNKGEEKAQLRRRGRLEAPRF